MKELKLRGKQIIFAVAAILLIVGVICGIVLNNDTQPVSKETPIKVKVLGIAENATGNSLVNGENIEDGEETSATEVSRIAAKEPEKADVKVRNLNYANKNHTIRLELDGSDNLKVQNSTLTVDQIVVKVNDVVVNATKSFESGPEELNDGKNGKKYVLALTNVTGDGVLSITIPANTITDEAGNNNGEITSTFDTRVIIDNTAPTRPICTASFVDGSGSYTSGTWTAKEVKTNTVSVDWGAGTEKFQYSVNDGEWIDCTSIMPTGTDGGSFSENTWTFATGKDDVIKFRAVDYLGNTSVVSNDFNIKYDNTAPTLTLAKDTYQEGFDGWTIPTGASVDNDGVLTISDIVAVWTPKYKTDGEKWYPEYDALTTTEVDNAGNGGVQNSLEYYNNEFELINSDGVAFPIPVNQWGSSLTASRYRNQTTGNGGNIKYVQIGFALGTEYSQPVVKVKNFKMHGQLYTEFYDIKLTPNGTYSGIANAKFAKGNQAKAYFASAGTNIENNTFRVTENGIYTVYVEDEAGNSTVSTIEVTKIDKTAPVIEANGEFNGTSISFTTKDIAPGDNETPSGVVGYQITDSQTAPTTGWTDLEVPAIETVDGKKQTSKTVSVSSSNLSAGTNYIWVIDAAGHKTCKEISVSYNLTYDYQDNDTYTKTFLDTGYTIDWSKKFRVEETFKVGTLGQRYLLFGNYPTKGTLNIEVTEDNKIRVLITDSTTNTPIIDEKSSATIANNEDISLIFEWNSSTKKYSLIASGATTNITMNSDTVNITRVAEQALRVGQDYRDTTYGTFQTLNVTAFKIIENVQNVAGVSTLPTPAKQGYTFNGWFTQATGGVQKTSVVDLKTNTTLYGRLNDMDAPFVNIEGGLTLNRTSTDGQNVTLKGSDGIGITAYYWGTTEPTSAEDCTITTAADIEAITSDTGLNKTINEAGTYWFACRDAAGNMNKKSIAIVSYTVNNLLENIAGERNAYTNANYTSASSATYIVKSGTSLTINEVAQIPTGASTETYRGFSTEYTTTPASVETGHSPEAADGTTYYVWFNRLIYTVTVKKNTNGGIMAETIGLQNNNVIVGSDSSSDKALNVKYGDTVRVTAEPGNGYTFTGWSGGYVSGNTNPVVGEKITENKEILATFEDSTAPVIDDIAGGTGLKIKATVGQTVTLKARDGVGITAYYWGTTEPTSAGACATTTTSHLTAITGATGLNKTINAAGTYWFACRDAAGNWNKKSITIVSYTVNNLLENIAGTRNTYTNQNYTSVSSDTYIVKSGTSLTINEVAQIPTGASADTYRGYSTTYTTAVANIEAGHSPGASNGTTYYIWFNRITYTVTLNKNANGGIMAETVTLANNSVTVGADSSSNKTLSVKYGDTVKVTAQPSSGYTFTGWSGGYVSGTSNPATGGEVTENKTVTATFADNTAPRIKVQAYKYSSSATNNLGTSLKAESTFSADGTYTVSSDWLNEGVTFKFTVYDEVGVKSALWEENTAGIYQDTGNTYSGMGTSFIENGVTNGVRYLTLTDSGWRKAKYTVRDIAGNTTTVTVITKIDKSAPTLSGTVTANIDSANQLTFSLNISSASDVGSGILGYEILDGATSLIGLATTTTTGTETIELPNNTDWYSKDLVVKAKDKAGNFSAGLPISYYTVNNVSGLNGLSACINTANTNSNVRFKNRTVKQTSNISFPSGGSIIPIGGRVLNSSNTEVYYGFEGTFDGQNYTISGYTLPNTSNIVENGLFGYVKNATITNVNVSIAKKSGMQSSVNYSNRSSATIGGIIGTSSNSTISNCTASGYITSYIGSSKDSKAYIGGICARADSGTVITGCTNNASITTEGNTYNGDDSEIKVYTGGIAGYVSNNSKVKTNIVNNGTVRGTYETGGIVAYASGEISGCTNNGLVSSDNSLGYTAEAIGGIVGKADSPSYCTITNCTNTGKISSFGITSQGYANLGGIVGKNEGVTINSATNNGEVATLRGSVVGGVVGNNIGGTIKNSTNNENITYNYTLGNEFACIGGIAGKNYGGTISDCSSSRAISTMDYKIQRIGGIVGQNENDTSNNKTAIIQNCTILTDVLAYQYVGGVAGDNVNGTISGCTVDNNDMQSIIGANKLIGGIAGNNGGTISNCDVSNKYLMGRNTGGGIAGNNTGTIRECTVLASNEELFIDEPNNSDSGTYQYIGGIAGKNSGNIVSSQFLAMLGSQKSGNSSQYSEVGGIAGYNESAGNIVSCLVNSEKIGGISKVGGIAGNNEGDIESSGAKGNIYAYDTGSTSYVGGVAGINKGFITLCYNRANVGSSTKYSKISGGIVGGNASNGYIEYCYNTGSIYGGDESTGGIAGANTGELKNCYNRGFVKNAPSNKYYGITGNNTGTWNNCYYLTGSGAPPNSNSIGTAKNETYLKTTLPSEWSGFFKQDKTPNINSGYAILFWE